MESEARYMIVGTVVVGLTVALVLGIMWFVRTGSDDEVSRFAVYFRNQSLSGLQVGSGVTMRGLKIGKVDAFTILPQQEDGVRVVLSVDDSIPIDNKTVAFAQRSLLTGIAQIELAPGGEKNLDSLKQGIPAYESLPIIPEGKQPLEAFARTMEDIAAKVDAALGDIQSMLSPENREEVRQLLANVNRLSEDLSRGEGSLPHLIAEVRRTTEELKATSQFIRSELPKHSDQLRGTAQSIQLEAETFARSVDLLAQRFSTFTETFAEPRSLIFGPQEEAYGPGEGQ